MLFNACLRNKECENSGLGEYKERDRERGAPLFTTASFLCFVIINFVN